MKKPLSLRFLRDVHYKNIIIRLSSFDMNKEIPVQSQTSFFEFYTARIPFGNVRIQLFSLQLGVNSRAEWDL